MKMALLLRICFICTQWILHLVTSGRTGLIPTPDMICPVTDSCSIKRPNSDPMLYIHINKKTPCCSPCSCEDSCFEIGNCCPSKEVVKPAVKSTDYKFFCTSTRYDYYNKAVETYTFVVGETYRMITTCLEGYSHDITTENKCVNSTKFMPESYDDIVVVSSTDDHDVIFRNKFCAECNGVTQLQRWELVVGYCSPTMLYETTLTGLDLYQYIITNCEVSSKPSADIKLKNIATCPSALIAVCNKTYVWGLYGGSKIKVDSDDVYSTNNHTIARGRVELYKNYFCCDCNTTEDLFSKDVCPLNTTDGASEPGISSPTPFTAKLDTSLELSNQEKHQELTGPCAFNEIYSEMEGLCRRLYCPVNSSPYNGRCLANSLDMTGLSVLVGLFVIPTETVIVEYIQMEKFMYVADNLLTYMDIFSCGVCSTVGFFTETNDGTDDFIQSLMFEFKINVDSVCKLETIKIALRQHAVSTVFHIEIKRVKANVKIIYFDVDTPTNYFVFINSTNKYKLNKYIGTETRCGKIIKLNPVFFCPYVKFTEEEYTSFIIAAQSAKYTPRDISDISYSNVTTIDSKIFRLISRNGQPRHYVTCIENILHKTYNNCARFQSSWYVLVIVTIVSYTRYVNY